MKLKFLVLPLFLLAACADSGTDAPYNQDDFANGGPDAPYMNERVENFMTPENQYSNIDSYKPKTQAEKAENNNRWNTARMETRWQEYKGAMVRVQILLGNTDLREMRLRLMQNANGTDVDGDNRTVLGKVAEFEMKRVCGRNADSFVIVYDNPSFDSMRPTPYFDYRIEAEGSTMREYGFRCIYQK
ncbi:MAG: hypothetical protein LBO08_00740 [Rickettsiales bacterium]|jgi:hypothetical protein|nr:hypothetical protein [Rickettsiales bacterium]